MFSTHSMKYIWYSPQKSKYPVYIYILGGETTRGTKRLWGAKRLVGAKRLGGKRLGGKRLGGETTRGRNGLGAKRPGFRECTILGPMLFSLYMYINDISVDVESEIRLFADVCVCNREGYIETVERH